MSKVKIVKSFWRCPNRCFYGLFQAKFAKYTVERSSCRNVSKNYSSNIEHFDRLSEDGKCSGNVASLGRRDGLINYDRTYTSTVCRSNQKLFFWNAAMTSLICSSIWGADISVCTTSYVKTSSCRVVRHMSGFSPVSQKGRISNFDSSSPYFVTSSSNVDAIRRR